MKKDSEWVVSKNKSPSADAPPSSTAMAWARDMDTGEPVYVLELDKTRTRSNCRCECPSCDLPLIAINAAREEYNVRPHFRHPKGAPKSDCLFLSARLAAMEMLREQGVLMLPSRRMTAQVIGLSGSQHEGWHEYPNERVRIRAFDFHDKVSAILTLDDGRQLRVQLTGNGLSSNLLDAEDGPIATILLEIHDLNVASMSREELRSKITLVPDNLCWQRHWNDQVLKEQAHENALNLADELMDLEPDDSGILDGVDPKFRRETLLHFEVKKMLKEAMEIMVPPLQVKGQKFAKDGMPVIRQWDRPSEIIPLLDVQLEKKQGQVIPDVIAKVSADRGNLMMIEVTVTNKIDHYRLARIRENNLPTLEIDLSKMGGIISRSSLKACVVYGLETKRWLFHPEIEIQQAIIDAEIGKSLEAIYLADFYASEYKRKVLSTPLDEIRSAYIDAALRMCKVGREIEDGHSVGPDIEEATKQVRIQAEKLAIHGYPEANDIHLLNGSDGIVQRILLIKSDSPSENLLNSLMDVINPIRHSSKENSSNHSIYLIALKVYRSDVLLPSSDWYTNWRKEIVQSIHVGDKTFIRDGRFDRLLSLLFPEIAEGLAGGYGTVHGLRKKVEVLKAQDKVPEIFAAIDFDQIRIEAEKIKAGESFVRWFQIWNDRYSLKGNLNSVVEFLCEIGLDEDKAKNRLAYWSSVVKERGNYGIDGYVTPPYVPEVKIKPEIPTVNLYALAKGRDMPRK